MNAQLNNKRQKQWKHQLTALMKAVEMKTVKITTLNNKSNLNELISIHNRIYHIYNNNNSVNTHRLILSKYNFCFSLSDICFIISLCGYVII